MTAFRFVGLARGVLGLAAVSLLCLGQGCPPSSGGGGNSLPGSATIYEIGGTGATVGGTGLIRVTLIDPVSANTDIALSSSNPAIATVPDTATIVAGSDTVEVPFSGVAPGEATIAATIGDSTENYAVEVVSELLIGQLEDLGNLQTGATASLCVDLNIETPSAVTVNLTSDNPAVLSVPATITILPFHYSECILVTAGNAGTANITASLGTSQQTTRVMVVDVLTITWAGGPSRLQVGGTDSFEVDLSAYPAADTTVTLSVEPAGVISIPDTVVVPVGMSYAYAPITALAPGQVRVTASIPGSSRASSITVAAGPSLESLEAWEPPVLVGGTVDLTARLDMACAANMTVALSSSNPAVMAVPDSLVIPSGSSSRTLTLTALAPGTTVITGTLNGVTLTANVNVGTTSSVAEVWMPENILTGAESVLHVYLDYPPLSDVTVTLTCNNPAVLTVPPSVVIPMGENTAHVIITGGATGTAVVTATLGSSSASNGTAVTSTLQIDDIYLYGSSVLQIGAVGHMSVNLNADVLTQTQLSLSTAPAGVVAVPSTMTLGRGGSSVSIPILAVGVGTAQITINLGGSNRTQTVSVVATPVVSGIDAWSLKVGRASNMNVNLSAIVAADTTINLVAVGGGFTVPATVVVPAGQSSTSFTVVPTAVVATTITATLAPNPPYHSPVFVPAP